MATAIITGASQGIGACIAKRLAKDGYNVAINCSSEKSASERGAAVAEKCRESFCLYQLFNGAAAGVCQCAFRN